ncbi:ABC transporter permease subunit [Cellulomonas soli]
MSPRRRARIIRVVQYAVLVAAVGAVALLTDWSRVSDQLFNPQAAADMLPDLPRAFWNTIRYTLGAFTVGLSVGTLLALMKLSTVRVYRWIATIYIEFFRGIPALLVVLSVAYAIPIAYGVRIDSSSRKHRSRSVRCPPRTSPRPCGPASRRCPAARSRRPGRWACLTRAR